MNIFNLFRKKEDCLQKALNTTSEIDRIKSEINKEKRYYDEEKNSHSIRLSILTNKLSIIKSEEDIKINTSVREKIEQRFRKFDIEYEKSVVDKTKQVYELKKSLSGLLKDKKTNNIYKSELEKQQIGSSYEVIKKIYADGKLPKKRFSKLRRNAEKKLKNQVHYADAIVCNNKDQVLLLKRSIQDDMFPGKWSLPGGHVDPNEDTEIAAIRELHEETLLEIPICTHVAKLDKPTALINYYKFYVIGNPTLVLNSREHETYEWVDITKLELYDVIGDLNKVFDDVFAYRKPEPIEIKKADFENDIEKGKKANIGEVRVWSGKKMKKMSDGKWQEVIDSKGKSEKKEEKKETSEFDIDKLTKDDFKIHNAPVVGRSVYFGKKNILVGFFNKFDKSSNEEIIESVKKEKKDFLKNIINREEGISNEIKKEETKNKEKGETKTTPKKKENISHINNVNYKINPENEYFVRYSDHINEDLKRGWSSWGFGGGGFEGTKEEFDNYLDSATESSPVSISGFELFPNDIKNYEFGELYPGYWVAIDNINAKGELSAHKIPDDDLDEMSEDGGTVKDVLDFINKNKEVFDGTGDGESFYAKEARIVYSKGNMHIIELGYFEKSEPNSLSKAEAALNIIKKAFENGQIDEETFEKAVSKAHKYIRRDGTKGNYRYIYKEGEEDKLYNKSVKSTKIIDDVIKDISKEFNIKFSQSSGFTGYSFYAKIKGNKYRIANHGVSDKWAQVYGYPKHSLNIDGNESTKKIKKKVDTFKEHIKKELKKEDVYKKEKANKIEKIFTDQSKIKEGSYKIWNERERKDINAKIIKVDGKKSEVIYDGRELTIPNQYILNWVGLKEFDRDVLETKTDYVEKKITKAEAAFTTITKAFEDDLVDEATFLKAQKVYQDNAENRRLKRVGNPWGSSGQETPEKDTKTAPKDKENGKDILTHEFDGKIDVQATVEEHAQKASEKALQGATKSGDEELRLAAKKELERRESEHKEEGQEADEAIEQKEDKKEPEEKKKPEMDEEILELHKEHNLSRLPVGIPKDKIGINTEQGKANWVLQWVDPKTGKKMQSYSNEFLKENAKKKWDKIKNIKSGDINKVVKKSNELMQGDDSKLQQSGAIISIISETGLRPGSRKGFEETQNRGVTTLAKENIKIEGNKVMFEFKGKNYKNNTAEIENEQLANYLSELTKDKKDDEFIFDVTDKTVRDEFENVSPGLSLKDMRTYVATDLAKKILQEDPTPPPPVPEKGIKKALQQKLTGVYHQVANRLNNTPSMAKTSYIHPEVVNDWLNGLGVDGVDKFLIKALEDDLYKGDGGDYEDIDEYPLPEWFEEDDELGEEGESGDEDKIAKSLDIIISAYNEGGIEEGTFQKAIARKELGNYIKKERWVTKNGRTYKQNFYYKIDSETKKEKETVAPIGETVSPEVKGLQIEKYSDKTILIKGDTLANVDIMREIKKETVWGSFKPKLKGWLFGLNEIDKVLGLIWSNVKNTDEDRADTILNQKNSSLEKGDEVNINGEKGKIESNNSDETGIKYNVTLEDGTKLTGVNEKVIETNPETDDKKISESVNNAIPENRVKTEKKLYGIKPIGDIHKYSLSEYMGMHGLSNEDIQQAINRIKGDKKDSEKRTTSGTSTKPKSEKDKRDGLTKQQLISKLIYNHYQAVKNAIEKGEELSEKAINDYESLKELYNKKREAMSEETKRKISEALKKNKTEEEYKKEAQEIIDNLSKEDLEKIKNSFMSIKNKFLEEEQEILAELVLEREFKEKEKYRLFEKSKEQDDYAKKEKYKSEARSISSEVNSLDTKIRNQKNKVGAIANGGDLLLTISDKVGVEHKDIPDFTTIDTSDIDYSIESILTKERPKYIPEINEDKFKSSGYIFDTIKIGEDKYILSTNGYKEFSEIRQGFEIKKGEYDAELNGYVALTLDQVVLTQDYYTTKQKAKFKEEADRKNKRQTEWWNTFDDSKKDYYYNQKNFYEGMPVKVKKQVTKEKWNELPLSEKEKLYIPVKKYNPERLKSKFDEKHMATSFHSMYERFVNPEALRTKKSGETLKRGERSLGTSYASSEVWSSWQYFKETLDWKINDINIQREELSEIRSKAMETSYGESGVNNSLVDEIGIKIKRQNGDEIKPQEIEQIKDAWGNIQKTFGELKENATKDNLKISHAGKTFMFASKAIGIYIPSMKTIGVTAKLGENQLGFTMGHEVAHWIDNSVGKESGKRFASDNYESVAGRIAIEFRKNMNKKSDSRYINSTHECFARALEMHHAVKTEGKDALRADKDKYITSDSYVPIETYETKLKPLIEQFFEENKEFLKSLDGSLTFENN